MDKTLPSTFMNREIDDLELPPGIPDRSGADPISFPGTIITDTDRIAATLEVGPLKQPIKACPGWDLRQLAVHTGSIHRWATTAIRSGASPPKKAIKIPPDEAEAVTLQAWLRNGASLLADILDATKLGAPTWHPFPMEQRCWVWNRRMLIETMIHRWDAETAIGSTSSLQTDLAIAGIHEYLDLGIRHIVLRNRIEYPVPSLHIHCTDENRVSGSGEWLVRTVNGAYVLTTEHAKGDAALRGPSAEVLLGLTGRRDRDALDVVGDTDALNGWLELPSW